MLLSSSVTGAPKIEHPPQVENLLEQLKRAEAEYEHDEALKIRTQLWLDGPFQYEGRVVGEARMVFEEMNATALSLPPIGSNTDSSVAYGQLNKLLAPTLVMCGDLDLPGIRERSQYIAMNVPGARSCVVAGAAHLPSLERPLEVTRMIVEFLDRDIGKNPNPGF
ncbi:hypothetical protein D3C85_1371770 [compost metagenome]